VATTSKETALASAEKWAVSPAKAYTQASQLAADPDVDLAVIGVKLPLHYGLALPLLEAGKDAFAEWPLATTLDQVSELQAAARRGGGRTLFGLQARASPVILKVRWSIINYKRGEALLILGRPKRLSILARWGRSLGPP
jgi:predicted dehydrogenase